MKRSPVRAKRPARSPRRFDWRVAIIIVAGALAYAGGLSGPFVFDDRGSIIDNRTIEDLGRLQVLQAPHETPTAGRPAVNVSFAINYAFGGREVAGYHAANIAIHLLCGLAIFGIARRAQPDVNAAFAIALVWTVHPLASEAVNYVTQRSESLMALSYLLTIYCALRAVDGAARRARWEVAAVLACALGMASKESMVTAPLMVVLFDRIFLFPSLASAMRARGRLYGGLAATWLLLAALVWSSPRDLSAGFVAHDADVWTYLLNQTVMLTRYLWLALWPRGLVLYYGWPLPLAAGAVLPQAALVLALLALTAYALWRHPRAGFLGAWFFLTLAPTSSIVPIVTEVGAERRMYLALIAVVALGVMAFRAVVRSPRIQAKAANQDESPIVSFVLIGIYFSVLFLSAWLTVRHVRAGRSDLKGGLRLAVFMFAARMATWALGTHHVTSLFGEVNMFISALQAALYWAGMAGFMYLAFEPYLRKSAPERVISWTRLLSGDWRDPLVGRDVLIGGITGIGVNVLADLIIHSLPTWRGQPAPSVNLVTGQGPGGGPFVGVGGFPDLLFDKLSESLIAAFILSFLILFFSLLLRRKWLGVAAIWLLLMVVNIFGSQTQSTLELVASGLVLSTFVLVAARFGVLAMISLWVFLDIINRPITTELSAWYATEFILYAVLLIGLAIFGFYTSTAGQKLWTGKLFEE